MDNPIQLDLGVMWLSFQAHLNITLAGLWNLGLRPLLLF
ncbi:DUF4321 domain-containing protein [Sporanaerobium hydrogeniformans]